MAVNIYSIADRRGSPRPIPNGSSACSTSRLDTATGFDAFCYRNDERQCLDLGVRTSRSSSSLSGIGKMPGT